ncbi:MAG: hypothetical protein COA78_18835 [Blastopirellula sp.]|nr:MAG: hypothetical protein COA78_18835 [Blastopirellula sp.]
MPLAPPVAHVRDSFYSVVLVQINFFLLCVFVPWWFIIFALPPRRVPLASPVRNCQTTSLDSICIAKHNSSIGVKVYMTSNPIALHTGGASGTRKAPRIKLHYNQ